MIIFNLAQKKKNNKKKKSAAKKAAEAEGKPLSVDVTRDGEDRAEDDGNQSDNPDSPITVFQVRPGERRLTVSNIVLRIRPRNPQMAMLYHQRPMVTPPRSQIPNQYPMAKTLRIRMLD